MIDYASKTNTRFSVTLALCLVVATYMITGLTMPAKVYATTTSTTKGQTLPSCTDPTGQNLPCMMVISTLPPPTNAIQCQETSGQILSCSYGTQILSNGNQIVVITVYVPANFVFSSPAVIKVIVHETTTTRKVVRPPVPEHTFAYDIGAKHGLVDGKVGVYDVGAACASFIGKDLEHCVVGYHDAFTSVCIKTKFGCDGAIKPIPYSQMNNVTNTTVAASGGKGAGPTCVNNCTAGTPPPIDCKTNPKDPSCLPTQQQLTTPTSQTCPNGSQPDSNGKCPTAPTTTNPTTSGPPPNSNNNTPPANNPPPSGGSSNSNGGGDGNAGNNNPSSNSGSK